MTGISTRTVELAEIIRSSLREYGHHDNSDLWIGETDEEIPKTLAFFYRRTPPEYQTVDVLMYHITRELQRQGAWLLPEGVISLRRRLEEALRTRPSGRELAKQMAAAFCDVLFELRPTLRPENEGVVLSRFDDIMDEVGTQRIEAILREARYLLGMFAEKVWASDSISADQRRQLDEKLRAIYCGQE